MATAQIPQAYEISILHNCQDKGGEALPIHILHVYYCQSISTGTKDW